MLYMANIKEKIHAEFENIETVLAELEKVKNRPNKELVILSGIGSFLQNIYTGIENVLKQISEHMNIPIPQSSTWHKDLLTSAVEHNIITRSTMDKIGEYLFFRHFFAHSYGFLIDEKLLQPLTDNVSTVYQDFNKEIKNYLSKIAQ